MSQYYKQIQHKTDARRLLDERLARKEMGDAAYDKARFHHDDWTFRIVGVVLIVLFAAVVLGVAMLGY